MRIAIVGNREGWSKEFVFKFLEQQKITNMDIIISGGADGVDTYAQEFAKAKGCQMRILYPDPQIPSPKRYFDRNQDIADMCDKMFAFDKGSSEGSGTQNTINHAKKFGKEVIVIESENGKNGKQRKNAN